MNCVELRESLAEVDDGGTLAQRAHLNTCSSCGELLQELDLIVAAAGELRAADDPSPRIWNSIEIVLRQEGLIRPQGSRRVSRVPSFSERWGRVRWLVPAAAMLLLSVGIYKYEHPNQVAVTVAPVSSPGDLNDEDLIQEVADNTPAMRGAYEENLRRVNDSIRDSQSAVDENPNDEDARRSLMDAYQQKSMLFEMAMDRPVP